MRFGSVALLLSISIGSNYCSAVIVDEPAALNRFFDVTDGERWINATNWKTDKPICSWFGVTCANAEDNSGVTAIQLPQNNLVGRVAGLLYHLPNLKTLNLKNNKLRDADFARFADAPGNTTLEVLNLAGNSMTNIDGIGAAPDTLYELHVTANNVQGPIPTELFSLPNLKNLYFSFNKVSGSLPTEIGQAKFLEKFYMYGNDLSGSIPSEIGLLDKLQIFTMAENRLSGNLPDEVKNMFNLEVFSVHNNEERKTKLTGRIPSFTHSPFLSQLNLDGNAFAGTIPAELMLNSNVTSLIVTLGFSNNDLTGSIPTTLLKFNSLSLDVTGNKITEPLDAKFCKKGAWMSGLVEQLGCDALLCPMKTWNLEGRATDDSNCTACPSAVHLGSTECSTSSEQAPADWLALAKLYEASQGKHWNNTEGWSALDGILDTTNWEKLGGVGLLTDICVGWHGVVCVDGDVTSISLASNGLVGTIPTEIFSMPKLEILDLSRNTIEVDDDDGFAALKMAKSLLQISLSGTKITSLKGISQAPALKFLYIDAVNFPKGPFPTELLTMTNLRLLHFAFASMTGILPTEIGNMNKLDTLYLYNNELGGKVPSELGRLVELKHLELSGNQFTGPLPSALDDMISVERFHLHQTAGGLTGNLPAFDKFPRLKELTLDNNKFSGPMPLNFLQGITSKSDHLFVSIAHNKLTGNIPTKLQNFDSVDIRLEGNQISGIPEVLCVGHDEWMNGQVGKVGKIGNSCDAILCPKGTFSVYGKQTVGIYANCSACPTAEFFGSIMCGEEDSNPEKTILDTLFKATMGHLWKRKANWTEAGVPICYREGIVCTGQNKDAGVSEIELLDNGLKGMIPANIFDLPEIRLLGFTDNQVDISFSLIAAAEKLVVLKLSNSKVRSLAGLKNAPEKLAELHLAGNQITGAIPSDLYDLTSIRKIFMNNNLFTGSISSEVSKMAALQEIYLAGNQLTGHIPPELAGLQSISRIDLELNYLSGNLPTQLNSLTTLRTLWLKGQKSKKKLSGPIVSFAASTVLNSIDLSDNDFSGTIPDDFMANAGEAAALFVDLEHNRISGSVPESLATRFTNLFINLADNQIGRMFDTKCENSGWMNGQVGDDFNCDAILCPPYFAASKGRQIAGEPCYECPSLLDAPFFGATECNSHVDGKLEKTFLVEIYKFLNGTNWVDQTNWNSDTSICTWFGIVCNADGVSEFNMESNGLVGNSRVSSLFFSLPNLVRLDIKGNAVPLNLTEIPTDSKLRVLVISATGLKSIGGISNAKDMRRLHITDNAMTGSFPQELFKLNELRSLYMSFNSFYGSLPTQISKLTHLEEFYMFGNMIDGSLPGESIAALTNMREFIMPNNFLSGTIPNVFNRMAKLEQLSLYDQKSESLITGTLPHFRNAPKMWYFDISNNDLTGSIPSTFMENSVYLNEDVTVYLSNNELTGAVPVGLDAFSSLDILIVGNSITSLPSVLCDHTEWMQGHVGLVGSCNAIACPPGTYTHTGRQDTVASPCQSCSNLDGDNRYGQTFCEDISVEKTLLLSLYSATRGTSWKNRSKWNSNDPICSWDGVRCENGNVDDDSGVTGIDLEGNNLIGTMPASIWKLPFLKTVNFQDNKELHVNFNDMSEADSLESIFFSRCRVDSVFGISQAKKLRKVHLTECGISGRFPEEIFNMANTLEGIYIAYNSFTGTLSSRIGQMTNLISFFAHDNEFSGSIPTQIGTMSNLQDFVLSENLISGEIPTKVSSLANLGLFSIYRVNKPGAKLSGPLPSFHQNPKLVDLYLEGNDLTGTIPHDFLSASTNARLVTLSFNDLDGVPPESLVSHEILNLQLEGNKLVAFPPIFCNNSKWMDGAVGTVGCTAFLCPSGSSSPIGRANATEPCDKCETAGGALYFGSTSCAAPPKQRQILVRLHQQCGGANWYRSDDWVSGEPHCNWYGIECKNENVISINLGSNNLVGTPPREIFHLPELKTLELFSNPITFEFDNIAAAKKLTTLRLDSTGLSSLGGIAEAPSLTFLDVRFNALEGQFDSALLELENLRYLNMGNNKMTGELPLEAFSGLRYLKTLRLGSNEFTGPVPAFDLLMGLTTIDLSDNLLTGTIPANFLDKQTSSTSIEIDLSANQLTGWVPAELGRFEDLTIYLRENMFSELPVTLCDNKVWNDGDVEIYGCNGIICPPGTFNLLGRQRDQEPCMGCLDDSPYYGQVTCENPSSSAVLRVSLSIVVAIMATTIFF